MMYPQLSSATLIAAFNDGSGNPELTVPISTPTSSGSSYLRGGSGIGSYNGDMNSLPSYGVQYCAGNNGVNMQCGANNFNSNMLLNYAPTTTVTIKSFYVSAASCSTGGFFGADFWLEDTTTHVQTFQSGEHIAVPAVTCAHNGNSQTNIDNMITSMGTTTQHIILGTPITVDTSHSLNIYVSSGDDDHEYIINSGGSWVGAGTTFNGETKAPGWSMGYPNVSGGTLNNAPQPGTSGLNLSYVQFYTPWIVLDTETGLPSSTGGSCPGWPFCAPTGTSTPDWVYSASTTSSTTDPLLGSRPILPYTYIHYFPDKASCSGTTGLDWIGCSFDTFFTMVGQWISGAFEITIDFITGFFKWLFIPARTVNWTDLNFNNKVPFAYFSYLTQLGTSTAATTTATNIDLSSISSYVGIVDIVPTPDKIGLGDGSLRKILTALMLIVTITYLIKNIRLL